MRAIKLAGDGYVRNSQSYVQGHIRSTGESNYGPRPPSSDRTVQRRTIESEINDPDRLYCRRWFRLYSIEYAVLLSSYHSPTI